MVFNQILASSNLAFSNRDATLANKLGHQFPRSEHAVERKGVYQKTEQRSSGKKFRLHQERKWQMHFAELVRFKKVHNHCLVPYAHASNPELARWVKRQRYQHYLYREGKPSCMTQERIDMLDRIGFVWGSHQTVYQERIQELVDFKKEHGHCIVPARYPKNTKLATWVKCQRRQYKLYTAGRPSNMTMERILSLEKLGFKWNCQKEHLTKKATIDLLSSFATKVNTAPSDCQKKILKAKSIPRPILMPDVTTSDWVSNATGTLLNDQSNLLVKDVNAADLELNQYLQAEIPSIASNDAEDYRLFLEVISDLSSDDEDENDLY